MEKILVIDDDPLVLKTVNRILKTEGYQVKAVDSGAKAITSVADADYDLVMSDIRMPEMDGIETVDILQRHFEMRGKNCAFMFITGYPKDREDKLTLQNAALPCLAKPFEVQDLLSEVKFQLEARRPT